MLHLFLVKSLACKLMKLPYQLYNMHIKSSEDILLRLNFFVDNNLRLYSLLYHTKFNALTITPKKTSSSQVCVTFKILCSHDLWMNKRILKGTISLKFVDFAWKIIWVLAGWPGCLDSTCILSWQHLVLIDKLDLSIFMSSSNFTNQSLISR